MSGSFNVIGTDTEVIFRWTAPTEVVLDIVGGAAEYLFDRTSVYTDDENPYVFDDLTNQEKLNLVDAHFKQVILDLANTFKSLEAQRIARETEEQNKHEF